MTIKEFKDKLAEEIRNKLRKNNTPTPILDRLELHVKDFEGVSVQDIIGSKNMRHDVYVSFIYQICYPSRIKMDIDENYEPITKKRIAITSCKSTKQDYTCSADEMYSLSPLYRFQKEFFIKGYDGYYIMSSNYGLIHPEQIIKTYNRMVGGSSLVTKNQNQIRGWDPEIVSLVEDQINSLIKKGYEVDIHTSQAYYEPLSPEIKDKVNYIKQPQGPNVIKSRYKQVIDLLDNKPLKECLEFISHKSQKPKEEKTWWYHQDYEPFYGTCTMLFGYYKKKGIHISAGGFSYVLDGTRKHHRGWTRDKSFLSHLQQTDSGQWRVKKQK